MNRFEVIKDGLDLVSISDHLHRYSRQNQSELPKEEAERLKLLGVALRPRTPGYFLLRVRIPGGRCTADQLAELGRIARDFGRDTADITARAQLQLRWIRIQDVPFILDRLAAAGLVTHQTLMDSVRNIITCPLAGLTPLELFSVGPVQRELERLMIGQPQFINLPRKVNVAVSSCRAHCCSADVQDVALIPARRDGVTGFNLLAGGKTSGNDFHAARSLDVFLPVAQAAETVAHLIALYQQEGPRQTRSRARIAHMIRNWGLDRIRAELERRCGRRLAPAGADARDRSACRTTGVIEQKQPGLHSVGLVVPVGRIAGRQLIELARLARRYGSGDVRLTTRQNVILTDVPAERLDALLKEPLLEALSPRPHPLVEATHSCTGREYCSMAVIETKHRARQVAEALAERVPDARRLRIHWSGCALGCGQHMTADIGLLGRKVTIDGKTVEAVDVFVGGSAGPGPRPAVKILDAVSCDQLVDALEPIVRNWASGHAVQGEGAMAHTSKTQPKFARPVGTA